MGEAFAVLEEFLGDTSYLVYGDTIDGENTSLFNMVSVMWPSSSDSFNICGNVV